MAATTATERVERPARRLAAGALTSLPPGIRGPAYDRALLRPGLAHIGVGAFHRCHQAEYTDDLIGLGLEARHITGINVRSPLVGGALSPQDLLYSRTLLSAAGRDTRVLGAHGRLVESAPAAIEALADPAITVVTLTVTEKGYCHVPATGLLDERNTGITADIETGAATTLPAILVAAIARRATARAPGVTLIPCDNIPSNGAILRAVVRRFAEVTAPACLEWLDSNVRCPSTMVDRIVPATTAADRDAASVALGWRDEAAVVGEPFRQWVIENDTGADCPRWDAVGAEFVASVKKHELVKMRVLNGAQSVMSFIGPLLGLATTFDAATDRELSVFTRRLLLDETATTLPDVPGMGAAAYVARTFERLENPAIRHANHQIATDGSQKIIQRLLGPLAERRKAGAPGGRLAAAVAAFIAYHAAATGRFGARWQAVDPLASTLAVIAGTEAGPVEIVDRVFGLRAVFAADLEGDAALKADVARHLAGWLSPDPRGHLRLLA